MRMRWYFTFVGKGYRAFECDETQVVVNGDLVEALNAGFCIVKRLDGSIRFINMANVKFIDVFEFPDQLAETEKDRTA